MDGEDQLLIYATDSGNIEVQLAQDSVWLTQAQLAELFGTKRPAITKHLGNIFRTRELDKDSVCSILEHTAADGKRYKAQYYNLDAIISVGYWVNSANAARFRQRATVRLKEHLERGYTLNEQRLKQHQEQLKKLEQTLTVFQKNIIGQVNLQQGSVSGKSGSLKSPKIGPIVPILGLFERCSFEHNLFRRCAVF